MTTPDHDTIFALASAPGRAGVAVLRISGPKAADILRSMSAKLTFNPRHMTMTSLRDHNGHVFDQAMTVWFPRPHSFTGEDVVELHLHGGAAVINAAAAALAAMGARPAAPGEFSRRAFESGKLDLTQAEAIADLVDAETEAQRDQALRQMRGDLSAVYNEWRERLIAAMALIEAEIDFPDEGDVPGGQAARAAPGLAALISEMDQHLDDQGRGERVREGFHIAIIGPPNAGKSTLFNALVGRDAAIVTNIPGTTRDVVEAQITVSGFSVVIADTAGLRDSDDVVEREGVRRARARAEDADLRMLVLDAAARDDMATPSSFGEMLKAGDVLVANKADIADEARAALEQFALGQPHVTPIALSAKTGEGLDVVRAYIAREVTTRLSASEAPALTRTRHRLAVQRARSGLVRAMERLSDALSSGDAVPELAGEDARLAARALGEITGHVDVEEILDKVFAQFCIGK